jgi:hypothetical protein
MGALYITARRQTHGEFADPGTRVAASGHVRAGAAVLVLITSLLICSCGGATALPTTPTPPNPGQFAPVTAPPVTAQSSLVGAWRGSVRSRAARAGSNTEVGFALNCSGRWEISSYVGGHFEGTFSVQGGGPETDWRCTRSGRIAGEVTPDNQVTIDFVPRFIPGGCRNVVGGERATGSRSSDSITVSLPYSATCEMALGGGAPSWDLDIAATITLTPW